MRQRRDETKEQFAARLATNYNKRKARAYDYLGGKCVDCGATGRLEFDHRIPSEKSFPISKRLISLSWEKLVPELDKCDLRCVACHYHKSAYTLLDKVDVLDFFI